MQLTQARLDLRQVEVVGAGRTDTVGPPGDLAAEAQRLKVEEPGRPLDVQQIAIRRLANPLELRPRRRPPRQFADEGVREALATRNRVTTSPLRSLITSTAGRTRRRRKTPPMPMNGSQ